MNNRYDNAHEYRHDEDRLAARTEPNNDEGTQCDFRKRVDHDDIRFEHLS